MMDLVRLGTYNSLIEANLVKGKLAVEGIDALVQADDLGSNLGALNATRGIQVLVKDDELATAMELLERMLPPGD